MSHGFVFARHQSCTGTRPGRSRASTILARRAAASGRAEAVIPSGIRPIPSDILAPIVASAGKGTGLAHRRLPAQGRALPPGMAEFGSRPLEGPAMARPLRAGSGLRLHRPVPALRLRRLHPDGAGAELAAAAAVRIAAAGERIAAPSAVRIAAAGKGIAAAASATLVRIAAAMRVAASAAAAAALVRIASASTSAAMPAAAAMALREGRGGDRQRRYSGKGQQMSHRLTPGIVSD